MRIRKRPMLPFFSISPTPQIAPDLPQQEKDARLRAREKLREEEEEEEDDDQGAEAKEIGSGFDPTTHHSRNPWIPHEEMKKRCCMLSTSVPKQVEAMEVKGEEREPDEDDEKRSPRDMSSKRNGRLNCGSAETSSRPSSSPAEGENIAFSFKKRKAHYQWEKETIIGKEKKMKTKLKRSDTPKKLDNEEDEAAMNKWGSNGSEVMEGSRCSRVNGRGWRCCQQTLVGYSLCEHHLGKGRLRSMSSVRSRSSENNRDEEEEYHQDGLSHEPAVLDEEEEEEDHDQKLTSMVMNKKKTKMMIMMNNKKKRSGMVKARSISSLLGQTHRAIPSNALL